MQEDDAFHEILRRYPESLTFERALSVLPSDWMFGDDWPDDGLDEAEAKYVLELYDHGTMRWVAQIVFGDGNQILGSRIIEAANRAIEKLKI